MLAGGGGKRLRALVYHSPTPEIVPAALRSFLVPVHDDLGDPVDWAVDPVRLRTAVSEDPARTVPELYALYRQWRSGYVTDEALCDMATVRAFLDWSDGVCDSSAVRALLDAPVRIDPATATRFAGQLADAGRMLRVRNEFGVGLSDPGGSGLLRGFVSGSGMVTVMSMPGAALRVQEGRLYLDRTRLSAVTDDPSSTAASAVEVTGWVLDGEGIMLSTPAGPVPVEDDAALLFKQVAGNVTRVAVHEAPLTSVFAGLTVTGAGMALTAARSARTLVIAYGTRYTPHEPPRDS